MQIVSFVTISRAWGAAELCSARASPMT